MFGPAPRRRLRRMTDYDVIERLDAGEPPRTSEEARAREPYERLIARLRDLALIDPPSGWEGRAMARWRASFRGADPAGKRR